LKNVFIYIILILLAIYYSIFEIILLPAQGAHLWRQADCLAMVWNYKIFNATFFLPQMFNLISTEGKGVAEFPIFYFISAQFKQPEIILKWLHALLLFWASIRFYKLSNYFLNNTFYAICAVILLLSSPFIIFYGINFLSDVPAFCFVIIAFSFYFNKHHTKKQIFLCLLLLSIAALLKASYMLFFILLILLEIKQKNYKINFHYTYILMPILPILWYVYALYANAKCQNEYYFLSSTPFYDMSLYDIGLAFWRMSISWSKSYFWCITSIILIIYALYILFKKDKTILSRTIQYSFIITILFILLFLQKLIIHEYYYIFFYVFIAFLIISFFNVIQFLGNQKIIKIIVLLFLFINIYYCKYYINEKQQAQRIDSVLLESSFQNFLSEKKCFKHNTVLCYNDISLNQYLYAIKRKGYTQYNSWENALLEHKIDFILVKANTQNIDSNLQLEKKKLVGKYKQYLLYKVY
jgi:hypothetical protein